MEKKKMMLREYFSIEIEKEIYIGPMLLELDSDQIKLNEHKLEEIKEIEEIKENSEESKKTKKAK